MEDLPKVSGVFDVLENYGGANLVKRRVYGVWQFAWIGLTVAFFALFGLAFWVADEVGPWTGGGEVIVLAAAVVGAALSFHALQRFVNWMTNRRWYSRGVPRAVTVMIEVTSEGLVTSSELGRAVTFWSSFNEMAMGRHQWVIIGAGFAYYVPRDLFANEGVEKAFMASVLNRMSEVAQARSKDARKYLMSMTA